MSQSQFWGDPLQGKRQAGASKNWFVQILQFHVVWIAGAVVGACTKKAFFQNSGLKRDIFFQRNQGYVSYLYLFLKHLTFIYFSMLLFLEDS